MWPEAEEGEEEEEEVEVEGEGIGQSLGGRKTLKVIPSTGRRHSGAHMILGVNLIDCSLADVPEMSQSSNTAAAFDFLNKLRLIITVRKLQVIVALTSGATLGGSIMTEEPRTALYNLRCHFGLDL